MTNRKSEIIQKLFNNLAKNYDRNNDIISLFTHRIIKKSVVKSIPKLQLNAKILDICTGTGDIAMLLQKHFPNTKLIGVDFSEKMLAIAQNRYPQIEFQQANCMNLPFYNSEFDLLTESFGLRNTENYAKVVSEISRVLKPNGIFVHLDFGKNSKLADSVFEKIVNFVALFQHNSDYKYLLASKQEYPSPEELIKLFEANNMTFIKRKDFLLGIISAIYMQKL